MDKSLFAISDGHGKECIYEVKTGKKIQELFTGQFFDRYFSTDGTKFIGRTAAGIIRCYSVKTGELLVSTMSNAAGDYLTYTPEGYFTGNDVGMKESVHLVNGLSIIGMEQTYETLYRPDLVKQKLSGASLPSSQGGKPLKSLASSGDVPRVRFSKLPSSSNSRTLKVSFTVKDTGGGVGFIYLSLNGRVYQLMNGKEGSNKGVTYSVSCDVTLSNGENTIEAYATNAEGKLESRHATQTVTWQGQTNKPALYVLALGVNEYKGQGVNRLRYAVPDATSIAESFKKNSGSMYRDVIVETLLDSQVTKNSMAKEFDKLSDKITSDDVFVFYLSGHGTMYEGDYYFIPVDFSARSEKDIPLSGVSKHFLMENLSKIRAQKSLILLDTCNSGSFVEQMAFDRLAHATGQAIIAASSDVQYALEGYEGHGVFTYSVLQALSGKADFLGTGTVSVSGLSAYVNNSVPYMTMQKWGRSQTPWTYFVREDFPLLGNSNNATSLSASSGMDMRTLVINSN